MTEKKPRRFILSSTGYWANKDESGTENWDIFFECVDVEDYNTLQKRCAELENRLEESAIKYNKKCSIEVNLLERCAELERENERLREALSDIASTTKKQWEENPMYWATMANGRATEALNKEKRGE